MLDPFGIAGIASAAFNPLDTLDPTGLDVAEDASNLADALVFDEPGMGGEAHWNEEAKALIAGLILTIVASEPSSRRNLATLREYLTLAPELCSADETHAGEWRSEGSDCLGRQPTSWQVGPRGGRRAFRSAAAYTLPRQPPHGIRAPTLGFPVRRSQTAPRNGLPGPAPRSALDYSRWLRLLVTQSLLDMARAPDKPDVPVLYLLDGFASLGHLAPVERAMGLMAGYGVQL